MAALLGLVTLSAACDGSRSRRDGSGGDGGDSEGGGSITPGPTTRSIDLLLDIDNSRSMADKQEILALAIPELIAELVNPRCLNENGVATLEQPAGPLDPCPVAGSEREMKPVLDIHIGIVSSSLGGHGADACPSMDSNTCKAGTNFTNNDRGHLLSRKDPCGGDSAVTYQGKGFLAWDPMQKLAPPGEGSVEALNATLREMVIGVGQIGCGFEAQLESWYRFLADPEPYETVSIVKNEITPAGVDSVLLAQRIDFLRPDSLLAIVMLSDESDCSTKEFGNFYMASQLKQPNGSLYHLPPARQECAKNPNDPCCKSCGQAPGPECAADPTCLNASGGVKELTEIEDAPNVRCFDQKRRFGIDFLYPIDRYTKALTSPTVPNRAGELVPNPLFTDLNPQDSIKGVRHSDRVFLAAIVGVPWQDVALNKDDLREGFKSASELLVKDGSGLTTWDVILGDPAMYVQPEDPLMIESIEPRTGISPVTGDPIAPPGSPSGTNPINGHEYTTSTRRDDLQYACVFPLAAPRDCSDISVTSCDCSDSQNDSPLCEEDPLNPGSRTLQTRAKAYPGIRELQVVKSIGAQGGVASVCPAQVVNSQLPDYGYRPAMKMIAHTLGVLLK